METSTGSGTIGELFLALYEMGFEELQVRDALRAGCFRVQEAAEWILQGGHPRGSLHTQLGAEPGLSAVSAFNPPQDGAGAAASTPLSPDHRQNPAAEDLQPLSSSRRPQHRQEYEERQNANLAQEIRQEKRAKQQVRLPSGQSLRLSFPASSPLGLVCDHVTSLQPALAPCCLLQTFPTRHFGEAELLRSLHDLGLTPSATLCVRPRGVPAPPLQDPPPQDPPPAREPIDCSVEELMSHGDRLFPVMSSPAQSVSVNVQMREEPAAHTWGRGHRLAQEEEEEEQRSGSDGSRNARPRPLQPGLDSPSHQWPTNGLRLRPVDDSNGGSPPAAAPSPPHPLARAAAEMRQESCDRTPSPPRLTRPSPIPTLRSLALRRALVVISAPSMQFCGSLSGLTPDLAEMIIHHMVKERILRPKTLELFMGSPVRHVTLNCYPYCTNDLIRQLRGFPSLRQLSLSSASLITDQALAVLQHLHKLQHLNLSSCRNLTDSCLLHLRGLKHLTHVVLDQTKVSDGGVCDFLLTSGCPLTYLSANQTAVTERMLGLLVHHTPGLRVLSIKHTQVSDISSLRGLAHLASLHLDGTGVTQESLQVIRSLPALSTLTLSGAPCLHSNQVLELVSGLSLTRLVLPGRHSLTDGGLQYLPQLPHLRELDLTDHTHITDRGVQHLAQLARLRTLSLCNTSVTDAGLTYLRGLNYLEELSLDRTKVTSRGVSQCVPHLPHLQVLGLSGTEVGDNVLKLGIQKCRNLLKVNLSRTRVTNKGLRFLRGVPIVQINLDGSGVTLQGVSDLMAACPNLSSVRTSNLRLVPADQVSDEEEAS
ncbi:uncharacterized protein PAF06_018982 [Gastrophryne carolinensis]